MYGKLAHNKIYQHTHRLYYDYYLIKDIINISVIDYFSKHEYYI